MYHKYITKITIRHAPGASHPGPRARAWQAVRPSPSCPDAAAHRLLGAVAVRMSTELVAPGELLFAAGDSPEDLFLIESGHVDLVDPTSGVCHAEVHEGNFLGENSLLLSSGGGGEDEDTSLRHPLSARAGTWTVVHRISAAAVELALEESPEDLAWARIVAHLRWARLQQAVEAHRILADLRAVDPLADHQSLLRALVRVGGGSGRRAAGADGPGPDLGRTKARRAEAALATACKESRVLSRLGFGSLLAAKIAATARAPEAIQLGAGGGRPAAAGAVAPGGKGGGSAAAAGGRGGGVAAAAGPAFYDFDWSYDWVDSDDLYGMASWFQEACGAVVGVRFAAAAAGTREPPASRAEVGRSAICEVGRPGGCEAAARDLRLLLSAAQQRLTIVEDQTRIGHLVHHEISHLRMACATAAAMAVAAAAAAPP